MEYNQVAKTAINFQKSFFMSGYNSMARVQDQTAAAVDNLMNQTSLVPEAGRQTIKNWVNLCQEGRDRYKSYVEGCFSGLEKCFTQECMTAPKKAATPKTKA